MRSWLCVLLWAMAPGLALGQEVRSSLVDLRVGEQSFPFGSKILVVADATNTRPFRAAFAKAFLRARYVDDVALHPDSVLTVHAMGNLAQGLSKGQRYELAGRVCDAATFGGHTQVLVAVEKIERIGPSPPAGATDAVGLVDLESKDGEVVDITGTLLSLNGVWWLRYGDKKVYVTSAKGRSLTFPTDWHYRRVKVKGKVRQQLRASLDQISVKTARNLAEYPVILDADVQLVDGADADSDSGGPLYPETPVSVDGVFELIADQDVPRPDIMGNESRARSFAARNFPYLEQIIRTATAPRLDIVATRMETNENPDLRLLYAGILAACDDSRGRDYLAAQTAGAAAPTRSAVYVLGAFQDWAQAAGQDCEIDWVEAPALHCLAVAPMRTLGRSDLARVLMRTKSARGRQMLEGLILEPPGLAETDEPFEDVITDFETECLVALLYEDRSALSVEELVRLAAAFPEPEANRRRIAERLLELDEPIAAELFLQQIHESFWGSTFQDNAGPRVLAEVRRRAPTLSGEVRREVEFLLILADEDPVMRLVDRLMDESTPAAELRRIPWHLAKLGDPRGVGPAFDFLQARILDVESGAGVGGILVSHVIEDLGRSDDPEAVARMIDLLDADFSSVADKFVSVTDLREHVAGRLAEMTGEGFGTDPALWRAFLTR